MSTQESPIRRELEKVAEQEQILTLFRMIIRYGVMEHIPYDAMAGTLQGMAESIREQAKPLEWWIEHEQGTN